MLRVPSIDPERRKWTRRVDEAFGVTRLASSDAGAPIGGAPAPHRLARNADAADLPRPFANVPLATLVTAGLSQ